MDKIDELKEKGHIVSSSLNAVAFTVYMTDTTVKIVSNDEGFRMFCIEDNYINRKYFNEYKEQYTDLNVNLHKYNRIIKMLKILCKNYERGVELC